MLRKRAIAWFNGIAGCHLELVERLSSHKNFYFFTDFDIAKPCEFAHFFFLFSLRSLRLCVIILCILNSYQYLYISILIFFIFSPPKKKQKTLCLRLCLHKRFQLQSVFKIFDTHNLFVRTQTRAMLCCNTMYN